MSAEYVWSLLGLICLITMFALIGVGMWRVSGSERGAAEPRNEPRNEFGNEAPNE